MPATSFVRLVVPLAAVPLVLFSTGVGAAAADEDLRCRLVKQDILDPGLSAFEGSTGGFYTPEPGNMTCQGSVNGRKVDSTALGRFLEKGRYGTKDPDSCLGGEGDGVFGAIIPTEKGSARISSAFTFTYGEIPTHGGVIAGKLQGEGFSGTIDIIPLDGDCLTSPVTKIYTIEEIVFSSTKADWTLVEDR